MEKCTDQINQRKKLDIYISGLHDQTNKHVRKAYCLNEVLLRFKLPGKSTLPPPHTDNHTRHDIQSFTYTLMMWLLECVLIAVLRKRKHSRSAYT